jgi:multidrug resistance efflux pump
MDMNEANRRPAKCRKRVALLLIPATAFLCGIAATIFVAKSKQSPIRGVYRQEVVAVVAKTSGVILSIDRPHGQEVRPGDPLVALKDGEIAVQLEAATVAGDRVQRELEDSKGKAEIELATRSDDLDRQRLETRLRYADLLRTRLDVQLRRKALQSGERLGERIAATNDIGLTLTSVEAPGRMRQLTLADLANHEEVLDTQITLCEDRLAELDHLAAELPGTVNRAFRIDFLQAELEAATAERDRLESMEASRQLVSPAYGRVGVYRRQPGDLVSEGETLVEIHDAERPYVLATISLSQLGDFSIGRHVRVAFEGSPTRKPLEGVVANVISDAERSADAATAPGAAMAQIRITPIGRLWPTPPAGATALVQPL